MQRVTACREAGYGTNCEKLFMGDTGLATPVCDVRGRVVGAVDVALPASRWQMADAAHRLAPLVTKCACTISRLVAPL